MEGLFHCFYYITVFTNFIKNCCVISGGNVRLLHVILSEKLLLRNVFDKHFKSINLVKKLSLILICLDQIKNLLHIPPIAHQRYSIIRLDEFLKDSIQRILNHQSYLWIAFLQVLVDEENIINIESVK